MYLFFPLEIPAKIPLFGVKIVILQIGEWTKNKCSGGGAFSGRYSESISGRWFNVSLQDYTFVNMSKFQGLSSGRPVAFTLSVIDCKFPDDIDATVDDEGNVLPSCKSLFSASAQRRIIMFY